MSPEKLLTENRIGIFLTWLVKRDGKTFHRVDYFELGFDKFARMKINYQSLASLSKSVRIKRLEQGEEYLRN